MPWHGCPTAPHLNATSWTSTASRTDSLSALLRVDDCDTGCLRSWLMAATARRRSICCVAVRSTARLVPQLTVDTRASGCTSSRGWTTSGPGPRRTLRPTWRDVTLQAVWPASSWGPVPLVVRMRPGSAWRYLTPMIMCLSFICLPWGSPRMSWVLTWTWTSRADCTRLGPTRNPCVNTSSTAPRRRGHACSWICPITMVTSHLHRKTPSLWAAHASHTPSSTSVVSALFL